MEISKFHFYSIGTVAKNKELSSKFVEITPNEDLTMLNGEVTDSATDTTAKATDASGAVYNTSVTSTVTVNAEWLPISDSNRLTAPDVRRGEVVVIYQFGDSDKYYWNTLKADSKLRRLETVIYGFSATQDEGAEISAENMYFLEVSTHKKIIHLHTSIANGEPFIYDVQINTGEGYIQIQDDDNNFILFNSKDRRITMKNGNGSFLSIDKKNITISAPESLILNCKNLVQKASNSHATETQSMSVKSDKTKITSTAKYTIISDDVDINM